MNAEEKKLLKLKAERDTAIKVAERAAFEYLRATGIESARTEAQTAWDALRTLVRK